MSATPERRRRRIESRENVTFEGGTPEGRERLREARERVRGRRERQARELRQEVAQRARDEGLNVSEDDVRVREEEGEVVAEVREDAIEREQERAETEAREQAEEQALEAAEEQGLDVSREDIEVQEENGEFVARVEGDPAAEQEGGLTAETPTGRAVERAQNLITEPIGGAAEAASQFIREGGETEGVAEFAQQATLPPLRAEDTEAMQERLGLADEAPGLEPAPLAAVGASGADIVAETARAPELGIRIAEDAGAIAEPAFRAGTPTGVGERALPTGEEFTTAETEAEAVPGQVGTVAARTAEFAQEQPVRFASQLAVGGAISAGATGAASRAGVIPESVQRLPTTGDVAEAGVRRGARFTTEAGRRAVGRAAPVVRRELEATPIDPDAFSPITTQRQQVGAVFRQPEQARSRFRELDRPAPGETGTGVDRPVRTFGPGEEIDVDPPRRIETAEGSEFIQRTNEPDVQTTLQAFEGGDFDAPGVEELRAQGQEPISASLIRRGEQVETGERAAQQVEGEAFLEAPTRGFVEERTPDFEGEEAGLAERADVGARAQIGEADFGAGEQVVVEAARGQTALPEVAVDVVEPGIARRVLGEEPRVEIRGEPSTEAMQAATGEVLEDVESRFSDILEPDRGEVRARGERAEATLLGGEGRAVETEVETVTPEEAAREAIEQTEPRFIDPETPTERTPTEFDGDGEGAPSGFRFDFGGAAVSPVVEPDAPATGLLASVEAEAGAASPAQVQTPDLDITPAEFVGLDVTDLTDVAPAVDTEQEAALPALAFGAPTGGRGEVERAVPRTPEGFVPDEEEQPGERGPVTIFGEERVEFELPTVGELI
jgi:hypothetical protein